VASVLHIPTPASRVGLASAERGQKLIANGRKGVDGVTGGPVLILEGDPELQRYLTTILTGAGYEPVLAGSVGEALAALAQNRFAFTLLDVNVDDVNDADITERIRGQGGDPGPVVVLCDGNDPGGPTQAAFSGADEFVRKPFGPEELQAKIKEVLARPRRITPEGDPVSALRQEIALWKSPQMQAVWNIIQQAARVDVTVLLCGETGTGKDVVARAIHHLSSRHAEPLVKVNCAAVPPDLLESELFGHERGAFTGAHQLKIGKFESADHGTIFLDEIGELHPALQAKLLHVLQDGAFPRVGGKSTIKVDVRVLAATNRDLEQAVVASRFRDDLYYRLNVIQIVVPPLRERLEEIPLLAEYFGQRYAKLFHREGFQIAPSAMERLCRYRYPGNVRELENLVKRMIVLGDPLLQKIPFPPGTDAENGGRGRGVMPAPTVPLKEVARKAARAAEREAIARVLDQTGWNRVRAAKLLKISYRALLYKIKDAGLEREPPAWRPGT
jgi:two-component system, NtrC family, response regulator AtoC